MNELINVNSNDVLNTNDLKKLEQYKELIDDIVVESENILSSSFLIGKKLNQIKEEKLFEFEEYNDIYEFAFDKFKFKNSTVKNLINVYLKYQNENGYLDDSFSNFSYTALVELLPVENEKIITDYTSDMTISEIRQSKKISQLTDRMNERIKFFEEVIEELKQEISFLNYDLPEHAKIKFFERSKNLEFFDFSYYYGFVTGVYFQELSYKYIELKNVGFIFFRNEKIEETTVDEIVNKFKNIFNDYVEFVKSKKTDNENIESNKRKEKEWVAEEETNLLQLDNDYLSEIFYFIKVVLLKDLDYQFKETKYYIPCILKYFPEGSSKQNDVEYIVLPLYDMEKNLKFELRIFIESSIYYIYDLNNQIQSHPFVFDDKYDIIDLFNHILDCYHDDIN